jgi:hypothetical protein
MPSLLAKLITYRSSQVEVVVETGLDVAAKAGFGLCRDYAQFIDVILGQQTLDGQKKSPNARWMEPGCEVRDGFAYGQVRYDFAQGKKVTEIIEKPYDVEEDDVAGVYTFKYKMLDPEPFPLRNHWCSWTMTREPGDTNRCRLKWVRHFDAPMILGIIPLGPMLHTKFLRSANTIIDQALRPWYRKNHPSGDRRLPLPTDKVLVVGAGPSGLHMSHLLKNRLGVKDITVVELTDRVGGKTVTIDDKENPGIVHELGTCYLHPAYFAVRKLVQELRDMSGDQDFGKEVAPEGYAIEGPGREPYSLPEWVTSKLQGQPKWSPWALSRLLIPKLDTAAEILTAKGRYNRLHQRYFGAYNYTMPPKLTPESLEAIDMSFGQFLESNRMSALLPILAYGQTCQGYGSIESTPAFWAMCWITPELLNGYFEVKPDYPKKAMFREGWRSIWDKMKEVNDLNIEMNTKVTSIVRKDDGKMEVTTSPTVTDNQKTRLTGGDSQTRDFDYLVVAAPMLDPLPRESGEEKLAFDDLTEEQANLLQSNRITNGHFRTVLFTPREPQPYLDTHLKIDADRVIGVEVGKGEVFASRDSYLALNPDLCKLEAHQDDPARGHKREQMAYQYVENGRETSEEELEAKFVAWADGEFGAKGFKIRDRRSWTYFQRFDRVGLEEAMPWKLLELQGRDRTLIVHASTFFESVLDIVNYNNMIVSGLGGELNRLGPPGDDYKPDYVQTQHWKIFYKWVLRVPLTLLSLVTFVIWTALYIVLRPILGVTLIRMQRKYLQTAFKTENPGPWWKFNMSHFLAVSPSVRCLIENEEDAVITKAKEELEDEYPEIPKVDWALRWNYRDYRTGVRLWQKLIEPTYFKALQSKDDPKAPSLHRVVNWFSTTFPVIYNYVFSWNAALMFNCLTGYGVRIEDERGGGCYVPRCHMLRVARKEYGEDAGNRMCTHVCKIFTEEYMATLGMPCVLEPDQEKGSCMIRGVPEATPAFSDHEVAWWLEPAQTK